MKFKRIFLKFLFILGAALLISACGGGGSSQNSSDDELSVVNGNPDLAVSDENEQSLDHQIESDQELSANENEVDSIVSGESEDTEIQVPDNAGSNGEVIDDISPVDSDQPLNPPENAAPMIQTLNGVIDRVPFLPTVALDRYGNMAVADDSPSLEQRLYKGTIQNQSLILSEGDALPNIPRLFVDEIHQISVAQDGSVAAIVALRGQGGGPALVVSDDNGIRVVTYSDEQLVTSNTNPLTYLSINFVWRVSGKTLFQVTLDSGNRVVFIEDGVTIIALVESSMQPDVLSGEAIPTMFNGQCRILLEGFLWDSPHTFTESGGFLFSADYGRECVFPKGVARYKDGQFDSVIAEGQVVPGTSNTVFGTPEIVRLASDGTSVIQAAASREEGVFQEGNTGIIGRDRAKSLWEYSADGVASLIVAQGESVESPEGQIYLDGDAVDRRSLIWNSSGNFSLMLGDDGEKFLFSGAVREANPYPNFDSVGASSLRYVFSTLTAVQENYPPSAYYDDLIPRVMLPGGRVLFDTMINNFNAGGGIEFERYISGGAEVVDSIDLQRVYDAGHAIVRNDDILIMENGDILQHGTITSGGGYYFMTMGQP